MDGAGAAGAAGIPGAAAGISGAAASIPGAAASVQIQNDFALVALQLAGATNPDKDVKKLADSTVEAGTVTVAKDWQSRQTAPLQDQLITNQAPVTAPKTTIHRFAAPLKVATPSVTPRGAEVFVDDNTCRRFSCNPTTTCPTDNCAESCCQRNGISASDLLEDHNAFQAHRELFVLVLQCMIAVQLREEDRPRLPKLRSDTYYQHQARKLSWDEIRTRFSKPHIAPWPICCTAQALPASFRQVPDKTEKPNGSRYVSLQPAQAGVTVTECGEVAMAVGPEWQLCYHFLQAAAEPNLTSQKKPPSNGRPLAFLMWDLLCDYADTVAWRLVDHAHDDDGDDDEPADPNELFEVCLLQQLLATDGIPEVASIGNPLTVAAVSHVCLDRRLGHILCRALRSVGNPEAYTAYQVLLMVAANALGVPADTIDHSVFGGLWMREAPARSLVLFGDVGGRVLQPGQGGGAMSKDALWRDLTNYFDRLEMAQVSNARAKHGGLAVELGFSWQQAEELKKPKLHLRTLPGTLYHPSEEEVWMLVDDLLQDVPAVEVSIPLAMLADSLERMAPAERRQFFLLAMAQDWRPAMDYWKRMQSRESAVATLTVAPLLRDSGVRAEAVACAASVCVVLGGLRSADLVAHNLNAPSDIGVTEADVLAALFSCLLREKMGDAARARAPLASGALLLLPCAKESLTSPFRAAEPGYIASPLLHEAVYLSVMDAANKSIGRAHGKWLAIQAHHGLQVLRAARGYRSSYIVWFVDHTDPCFALDLAFHREHGNTTEAGAREWAKKLLAVCATYLPDHVQVVNDVAIKANVVDRKSFVLVSWDEAFHREALQASLALLRNTGAATDCMCLTSICGRGLDTSTPSATRVCFY